MLVEISRAGTVSSISSPELEQLIRGGTTARRLPTKQSIVAVPTLDSPLATTILKVLLKLGENTVTKPRKWYGRFVKWAPVLQFMSAFEQLPDGRIVGNRHFGNGHRKSRMIEDIGIGFSLVAAEKWIRDYLGWPMVTFLDIETLSTTSKYRLTSPPTGLRADWLAIGSDPKSPDKEHLFLVESKGTSVKNGHIKALRHAVRQIASTEIDHKSRQGLGVCTYWAPGELSIYAIDPPEEPSIDAPVIEVPNMVEGKYGDILTDVFEWRIFERRTDEGGRPTRPYVGCNLMSDKLAHLHAIQTAINLSIWAGDGPLFDRLDEAFEIRPFFKRGNRHDSRFRLYTRYGIAEGGIEYVPSPRIAIFRGMLRSVRSALLNLDFRSANAAVAEAKFGIAPAQGGLDEFILYTERVAVSDSGAVLAIIDRPRFAL